MKMNRNEMEALYAFGCPNLKATVERLRMVAALAPDPVAKKLFYMLSVKLSAEGVERWYRCFYCKLRVLMHVEGPYLNPKRAGEQFAGKLKNPDKEEYTSLLESTDCIKRWDASPELPGALEFARYLKSKGILVAVSHTESEYEGIKAAFEAGFTHTAHFYNGMPGFHKCREYKYEGTVESVYLTDGMTIELIADGIHLPATILRLAYKLKGVEKTCLVTDALAYAAADGKEMTDPNVIIEDGVCKMADHSSLAGSIATMDVLVRTMVKAGIPLADAVRMASETPARIMGVDHRKGALQKDMDADVLILDRELNIRAAWAMGRLVEDTNTLF